MRLHARHGWGYDAGLWAALAVRLPLLRSDDRGYFGVPRPDPVGNEVPYLLIGHSLGTMRMAAEAGPGCRGLVAINGFDRFVGGSGFPGVAPRLLARTARRCADDPDAAVAAFRAAHDDREPAPRSASSTLLHDLAILGRTDVRLPGLPLLRLDGALDPLLTLAHRAACFSGQAAHEVADAGHLLPLTHPGWCADMIAAFAEDLA